MPDPSTPDPSSSPRRVADLHCDLLCYLDIQPGRTPYDADANASIPQMLAGGVAFQVLAIFGLTGTNSARFGPSQAAIFRRITEECRELVAVDGAAGLDALEPGQIGVMAAIENSSCFCDEGEPLEQGLRRFEEIERQVGRFLYVSLCWGDENRFAGGNDSTAGLKDDGRRLVDFLAARPRPVALDFSHASPQTANELLQYIEREGLELPLLASHSCFASLVNIPRNVSDGVVRKILARGGLVGLNFLRDFLGGSTEKSFVDQVRHALYLGAAGQYCLGADYFATCDIPPEMAQRMKNGFYFPGYENASSYPRLFKLLERELPAQGNEQFLEDFAWNNLRAFLERLDTRGG